MTIHNVCLLNLSIFIYGLFLLLHSIYEGIENKNYSGYCPLVNKTVQIFLNILHKVYLRGTAKRPLFADLPLIFLVHIVRYQLLFFKMVLPKYAEGIYSIVMTENQNK